MKSFREFLEEGDEPVEHTWSTHGADKVEAHSTLKSGKKLTLHFKHSGGGHWRHAFTVDGKMDSDRKGTPSEAREAIHHVRKGVREFVGKHRPRSITWAANTWSKSNLYRHVAKKEGVKSHDDTEWTGGLHQWVNFKKGYSTKPKIQESLDKPISLKWRHRPDFMGRRGPKELHTAHGELSDGRAFHAHFHRHHSDPQGHWKHAFTVDGMNTQTGKGNQQEIMSTAVKAVRDFTKTHQPERLTFAASKADHKRGGLSSENSRSKLYSHILKKHVPGSGYNLTHDKTGDKHFHGFILDRVRESFPDAPGGMPRAQRIRLVYHLLMHYKKKEKGDHGEADRHYRQYRKLSGLPSSKPRDHKVIWEAPSLH